MARTGSSVLMLPALSSISTRREMWPLQERLGSRFTTLAIDWAGFGDRPRPLLRWSPEIYRSFLACLLNDVVPRPFATIAAGHAAAYCLDAGAARPGSTGRLCLIAPTWRAPLPTMMGKRTRCLLRSAAWLIGLWLASFLSSKRQSFHGTEDGAWPRLCRIKHAFKCSIRREDGCDTRVRSSLFFGPLCCRRT